MQTLLLQMLQADIFQSLHRLISSVFLKKQSLPIAMNGHIAIITSQVRIEIPTGYSRAGAKPKSAGGHAVKHYANNILEFEFIM